MPAEPGVQAALIVAHPGHELRIHHWLERERPLTFVLTHGDGSAGASRLASTTRVLERAGASPGSVYGRWRDADLYQALLDGRVEDVADVVDEIAGALAAHAIRCVVADAEERYNPSHDVCRYVADAVAARLGAAGEAVTNLEFPLVGAPDARRAEDADVAVLHLDEAALARKLDAARGYPEMAGEVEAALRAHGVAAFATEYLTPVRAARDFGDAPPFYEVHGARQVAAGRYREVLRYADHVRPLRERLAAVGGATAAAERRR